jgi:predicted HTH transcriptional regulator
LFEEYSGGLAIIFKFKEPIGIPKPSSSPDEQLALTLRQKKILKILEQEGKIALREIVSLLETPIAARTIGDDLAYLKQLGLVDSEGTGKGAKWFSTTSMGR